METKARFAARARLVLPARGRRLILASILLLAPLAGCTADPPLRPLSRPALVLEAGDVEIARVTDAETAARLLAALPAAEHARLVATGVATTSDPAFKAAVRRHLAAAERGERGGFSAHIRNATWGEIKIRYST